MHVSPVLVILECASQETSCLKSWIETCLVIRYSLRATWCTRVDSPHTQVIIYDNSCNVRHHVGKPAGEPAITRTVKVDETISLNKYFAYLHPSKRSSRWITSAPVVVTSVTWLLRLECSIFRNIILQIINYWLRDLCGCPHHHPSNPAHATACMYQVALKLYRINFSYCSTEYSYTCTCLHSIWQYSLLIIEIIYYSPRIYF